MKRTKTERKLHRATPPGPRNCMRVSPNSRACDGCDCTPAVLHTPIRAAGQYCGTCCPHCSPTAQTERDTHEATYIEAKNQMTSKTPRFSQLSVSRQTLVRVCQDVNFGQIQGLHVRNSDPVWDPAPTVLSEVRLDIEEGPRPEGELPDFKLSSEIQRLICQLDQLKDGRIEKIEVRGGVPRRLVPTSRLA